MYEMRTEDLARLIALATRDEPGYLSAARIFRQELAASGYTIVAIGDKEVIDVRQELSQILMPLANEPHMQRIALEEADAIMKQFDVVPKSAITMKKLGQMVRYVGPRYGQDIRAGEEMVKLLADAGLKIVRVNE